MARNKKKVAGGKEEKSVSPSRKANIVNVAPATAAADRPGLGKWVTVLIACFFAIRLYAHQLLEKPVRSTFENQPMTIRIEDALPAEKFESFKNSILSNVQLHEEVMDSDSSLASDNFGTTRGFVLAFNREGLEDLKNSKYNVDNALVEFWQMASVPNANAFVLNLLICPDHRGKSEDMRRFLAGEEARNLAFEDEDTEEEVAQATPAVGLHVDNTVQIDSWKFHVAYQVTALYLSLPEDIQGGILQLWYFNRTILEGDDIVPDEEVVPKTNMMVGFRGDAYHQVTQFTSPSRAPRVSLILENYYIGPDEYNSTARFKVLSNGSYNDHQHKKKYLTIAVKILDGLYTAFFAVVTLYIFDGFILRRNNS